MTAPKRNRGQPRKPLASRADRHLLAFAAALLDAHEQHETCHSVNSVLQNLVALKYGVPVLTPENLEANAAGRPIQVAIDKRKSRAQPALGDGQRHRHPLHGLADDELARPIRRTKKLPPHAPDRQWLAAMVLALRLCCCGDPAGEPLARYLASLVGESTFFEHALLPLIRMDRRKTLVLSELLKLVALPKN
jgi:hypothetical protein